MDVNEAPEEIIFKPVIMPVPEGTLPGTMIGLLEINDPDNNQSHTCQRQTESVPFTVVARNGTWVLELEHAIDYEAYEQYGFLVICTDGQYDVEKVTIQTPFNMSAEACNA